MYGGALWNTVSTPALHKAKVAYNDVFRMLFNVRRGVSVSALYVQIGLDCFSVLMRKFTYSLYQRLLKSTNALIVNITQSGFLRYHSNLVEKWRNT